LALANRGCGVHCCLVSRTGGLTGVPGSVPEVLDYQSP